MQQLSTDGYLTHTERKELMEMQDWRAVLAVGLHWAWIIAALLLPYYFYGTVVFPLVVLISLFVLGGKQLACAILLHDASHYAVFSNKKINDAVGKWLGAYPILQDMLRYRPYHRSHHINTGLPEDPDLLLTRGYPTTRKSMFRKLFRDLSGQTGLKALIGLIAMQLGYLEYNLGNNPKRVSQKNRTWGAFFRVLFGTLGGPILVNLTMWLFLYWFFSGWLYLLWVVAYITTFQFCIRVRSIAEHSMVEDSTDPYANTRTTYANFVERMLFAPYHVNYHVEHHLLMGVPSYNLPKMHQLIKQKGFFEKGVLESNYWTVLKKAAAV
ncbi:MAG: fatty acid desaturase family protein [Aureispira sp.]